MIAWLPAILASFPTHREDRDPEAKQAQYREVASAIAEASKGSRWRAAMLVTMGRYESDWSIRIGEGRCKPLECDRGRAVSNYQLHERACTSPEAWRNAAGDLRLATREAARAINRARGMCRHEPDLIRATFSALAGRGCRGAFRGLDARVATAKRLLGEP